MVKSSSDSDRLFGVVSGFPFQISNRAHIVHCMVEVVCHFFISGLEINPPVRAYHYWCEERVMVSSLSMNRMASMPEMLEPMGRPSFWRKLDL